MQIIRLKETASTNSFLRQLDSAENETVVVCSNQTAGRGQRGNSWEAEPGKNLTFSILLCPENIAAARQFSVSRAVALAVADCLEHWLAPALAANDLEVAVKWPNDIYVGDRKICGILIENSLIGNNISRSIVGIGLNVNQTVFRSDAPNPVSMAQIAGIEFDLDTLLSDLIATILSHFYAEDCSAGCASEREYSERLWRRDGFHPFKLSNPATFDPSPGSLAPGESRFTAAIENVDSCGMITLRHPDGSLSTHAFKEISFLL